ncbi:MAG TPA: ABC transporter ATP-binding protein [Candidatus Binatia bacterium]|nr:ABC transporter ATP-binding protein [Candidatus Binatia bacterium]
MTMSASSPTSQAAATQPAPPDTGLPPETPAAIVVQAVSRSFGPIRAVSDVSLTIRAGETVALLGPNGAGKTTLITMLLGLLDPDRGVLRLLGADPGDAVAAGRVGAMLQDGGLMPGARVGELLRFVRRVYPAPMSLDEACSLSQVDGFLDQRVDRLSGGQTQRVRVALALIGNPELLILDEPTASMDVEARRRFWAGMDAQASLGKTILFSTHYLEEADAHCDRVVVIGRGRILADGTPASIKSMVGLRAVRCRVGSPRFADDLRALPGVSSVTLRGDRVEVLGRDTDLVLRWLLAHDAGARDIEVSGLDLEEAFLALTETAETSSGSREQAA